MNKTEKINELKLAGRFVTAAMVFCVILIVIGCIGIVKNSQAETETYPSGKLSNSIYEYQNNEYESSTDMTQKNYIYNGHYVYDMYDAKSAEYGNSVFYQVTSDINVGITTADSEDNVIDIIEYDYEKAFGVSDIKVVSEEKGYRNGWSVYFYNLSGIRYDGAAVKLVAYVALVDEGYFAVSGMGTDSSMESIFVQCEKVYCTMRVSDEWKRKNETETAEMFVPETTTSQEQSDSVLNDETTNYMTEDVSINDTETY